jgi:DedD protein
VDIKTKQRLVGAVVLVSLLVIFLPMILTGGGEFAPRLGSDAIPEAPEYQFEPLPVPQPIAPMPQSIGEAARPESESAAPAANAPATSAPSPAPASPADAAAAKPPVSGWVIQIGSFGDEKNANALSDRLRGKGYTSFVEASRDQGKTVYRVRVGPELTRELAVALQQKLVGDGQPAGLIMTYP